MFKRVKFPTVTTCPGTAAGEVEVVLVSPREWARRCAAGQFPVGRWLVCDRVRFGRRRRRAVMAVSLETTGTAWVADLVRILDDHAGAAGLPLDVEGDEQGAGSRALALDLFEAAFRLYRLSRRPGVGGGA